MYVIESKSCGSYQLKELCSLNLLVSSFLVKFITVETAAKLNATTAQKLVHSY